MSYLMFIPGIPHSATQDDWYGDFFIPKGSLVMSNLWRVQFSRTTAIVPKKLTYRIKKGRSRMTRRYTTTQVRSALSASWALKVQARSTRTRSSSASADANVPASYLLTLPSMRSCQLLSRRLALHRVQTGHRAQTSSLELSGETSCVLICC